MSLDSFGFPSAMNMSDDEKQANSERVKKARLAIEYKLKYKICSDCGKYHERGLFCECVPYGGECDG
ncbi:hypothetical protein KAR91_67040 [Candidatus Pacearchaeota archaeon]|nr:hypothetical protein [Candidatus Pacearchaeota archaeon]